MLTLNLLVEMCVAKIKCHIPGHRQYWTNHVKFVCFSIWTVFIGCVGAVSACRQQPFCCDSYSAILSLFRVIRISLVCPFTKKFEDDNIPIFYLKL